MDDTTLQNEYSLQHHKRSDPTSLSAPAITKRGCGSEGKQDSPAKGSVAGATKGKSHSHPQFSSAPSLVSELTPETTAPCSPPPKRSSAKEKKMKRRSMGLLLRNQARVEVVGVGSPPTAPGHAQQQHHPTSPCSPSNKQLNRSAPPVSIYCRAFSNCMVNPSLQSNCSVQTHLASASPPHSSSTSSPSSPPSAHRGTNSNNSPTSPSSPRRLKSRNSSSLLKKKRRRRHDFTDRVPQAQLVETSGTKVEQDLFRSSFETLPLGSQVHSCNSRSNGIFAQK